MAVIGKSGVVWMVALWGATFAHAGAGSDTSSSTPDLPATFLQTDFTPAPCTVDVVASANLQTAIDRAKPGDVLCLPAGARYSGHFILRRKEPTDRWIVIRSAASTLPPPGNRVSPQDAGAMPLIITPDTEPAISTESQAHHYRLVGLNITGTHASTDKTLYSVVNLGGERNPKELPHDIILDRCYIHGSPTGNVRRDVALNAARVAVIDSWLSEAHEIGADSQAIISWLGGPLKIVNNYLEGAAENVMLGGAGPAAGIPVELIPSDVEIRRNYFFKPLRWKVTPPSAGWSVKNLFEIKNARRVLVEGNLFENSWIAAQSGFAIMIAGVEGPASTIENITFTKNWIKSSECGVAMNANANGLQLRSTNSILISNNIFENILDLAFQLSVGVSALTIDHNTIVQRGTLMLADPSPTAFIDGLVVRDNIMNHGRYGIHNLTLNNPPYRHAVITNNVIAGKAPDTAEFYTRYPGNVFPESLSQVLVNENGGSSGAYRVKPRSRYMIAGTDGKTPGAAADVVEEAAARAKAGR